jgi:DNA-binding beta-propeller fold protein YncE
MDRLSLDQIDRQLGSWLRDESETRAPASLVEDVFARTSRTGQARRWWPPVVPRRSRGEARPAGAARTAVRLRPALAGAAAVVLAVVALALVLRPAGTGPGVIQRPSPSPIPPSLVAPSSAAPSATPSATPAPTPVATTLDTLSANSLFLGPDAAPIAVTEAFGSIWVADIHANDVRRFEPGTMRELARIPVPSAAWFAVADGALWVTSQTGTGLSRIDPATNRVVAHVGDVAPCSAPVVAFGSIWQSACDAGVILRIDPTRNAVVETIPSSGYLFMVLARGQLTILGPEGLARLDPETRTFTAIPNPAAIGVDLLASDGTTVWVTGGGGATRIDPITGRTIGQIPNIPAMAISFAGDHAWLAVDRQGVSEIDMATNAVRRTIKVLPAPLVPLEANGRLWVTDFETSVLWRIDL